jgi:PiT family inorganic phosphate transporter
VSSVAIGVALAAGATVAAVNGANDVSKGVATLVGAARMDHAEGFAANAVSAALVAGGATLGLPMSTTHVSAIVRTASR